MSDYASNEFFSLSAAGDMRRVTHRGIRVPRGRNHDLYLSPGYDTAGLHAVKDCPHCGGAYFVDVDGPSCIACGRGR